MSHILTSDWPNYTSSDVQGMSKTQLGGPALELLDSTGNHELLRRPSTVKSQLIHQAEINSLTLSLYYSLLTERALGGFTTYTWAYADVSSDPDFLPWSVVSGTRPPSDTQLIVFIQGQLIKGWTASATGINLPQSLTTGQTAQVLVISESIASSHTDHVYYGSSGTGAGNLVWQIENLDSDIYGETPVIPSATNKIWVFLNGIFQTQGVGVTVSVGSGTATVTFLASSDPDFEVQDDDIVTFIVWRA